MTTPTPLQSLVPDLRADAEKLATWAATQNVPEVRQTLTNYAENLARYAAMLAPLNLGEFSVVNPDGSRTPTNRVRMPKKR
jgi:hypothetical protein